MSAANASMSATQWILLLTLSLVWGGSYFFVGLVLIISGLLVIDGRLAAFRRDKG